MDFLFSNLLPFKTQQKTFAEIFFNLLPEADRLDIAVGFITADSLVELQQIVAANKVEQLNLIIGMYSCGGLFTEMEYKAAIRLNEFLQTNNQGKVNLVTPFRFHGKLYSYWKNQQPIAGIIGSNNLGGIVQDASRIYEASVLTKDPKDVQELAGFISNLDAYTQNIKDLSINNFKNENPLLEGQEFVEKVPSQTLHDISNNLSSIRFKIPIKTYEDAPKSNLNAFFGKGREDKRGLVRPRHWYEVELIVPKKITQQKGYPQSNSEEALFTAITDDGWKFKCKISGDYSKNFRSEGDLTILGKWLKGRLEQARLLEVGKPVTSSILAEYGRRNFELIKTKEPGVWFLDFKGRTGK